MAGGGIRAAETILFDLDGTLVDTAPDMVRVLIELQLSRGVEPVDFDVARNYVSNGALALLRLAFPAATEAMLRDLHREYLDRYEASVCEASAVFPGLGALLDQLDEHGTRWGVVTNKPQRMTAPLLDGLGLLERAVSVISGDTLPEKKPHPAPLLLACEQAGSPPSKSVYVGDTELDIAAGRAAGMATVVAAYGYLTPEDNPDNWGADAIAADTVELGQIVCKAVTLGG